MTSVRIAGELKHVFEIRFIQSKLGAALLQARILTNTGFVWVPVPCLSEEDAARDDVANYL